MTTIIKYDPKLCVTAKELRNNGVQVPLEIPDRAWVPKLAVIYDMKNAQTTYVAAEQRINSVIPVHVNAEWVVDDDG